MKKIERTFYVFPGRLFTRNIKSQSGTVAVEFVLILPALLLVLFGIIEFGIFFLNKHVITNASREGARAGIVSRIPRVPYADIKATVDAYCKKHLVTFGVPNEPITVTNPAAPDDEKFGDDLKVTVTFNYDFLLLPLSQIPMKAITIMRYE